MAKPRKPGPKEEAWIDARKRHRLSHAEVQMARELGMQPKTLGKLDNHRQQAWKMPLPQFIEHLYFKRFGRERPEVVLSVEERFRRDEARKAERREAKKQRRSGQRCTPPCDGMIAPEEIAKLTGLGIEDVEAG